jgi:D-alanine-D-alanine ligase
VLQPLDIVFPEGEHFKTFELKWGGFDAIYYRIFEDEALNKYIADVAKKAYLAMDCRSIVRFDIRMTSNKELYVLEGNTRPAIFFPPHDKASTDYIIDMDPAWDHIKIVETMA